MIYAKKSVSYGGIKRHFTRDNQLVAICPLFAGNEDGIIGQRVRNVRNVR